MVIVTTPASGCKPGRTDPAARPHFHDSFLQYEDDPGAYMLPAGPCKGKRLDQLTDEYLAHVAAKNWHAEVRDLAERVIRDRALAAQLTEPEPDPTPAAHVGQLVVTRGRHEGKRLDECPVDYLLWLVEHSTSAVYKRAAAELLGIDPQKVAAPAIAADPRERDQEQPDRPPDRRPVLLTDGALNEVIGVLFKLADELDRMNERVWKLEAACRAAGIDPDQAEGSDPA